MKLLSTSLLAFLLSQISFAGCIPFSEAKQHIGETKCVSGKVVGVKTGSRGVHYLDFCQDYRTCPFTVVIFAGDLKHVGDVRQLQGNTVEIHGPVKGYDNRAEIILKDFSQFGRNAPRIPPLPKDYDVERRGNYSAGIFSHAKPARTTTPKKQTATLPIDVPEDNPN
jgi:hypothetical protein